MKSELNFNADFSAVEITDGAAIISMPLLNTVFREIWDRRKDKNIAAKELGYIGYIASYKSPGNIKGLSRKELRKDAIRNIGLPITWEEDHLISKGIDEAKKLYDYGVFGTIKTIRQAHDYIRRSTDLLSRALGEALETMELESSSGQLIGDHLKNRVKSLVDSFESIKSISTRLDEDVRNLRNVEKSVTAEELKQKSGRGDTYVPRSANPESAVK